MRGEEVRRRITIELTPKNQAMQRLYDQVSSEMTRLFYRGFGRSEVARFEKDLERILANVSD